MTAEEAKSELKRHQNLKARGELQQRLAALPAGLAAIGLAVVDGAGAGYSTSDEDVKRKWVEAKRGLEKLNDPDRRTLFAALFPPIAEHVEASWRLQMKLPYQTGHMRKAFRAPNHPAYTADSRSERLHDLLQAVLPYHYDLEFLIIWAAHLRWGAERSIGLLLAAVLDADGNLAKQTLDTLISIINGEHETARVGRYAVTALLCCGGPEAWAVVERLMLAAQRQEGLRQVVIESIDFAHPEAFRRMLRLIQQEKLSRFAAVARGAAVWFGMSVDSAESKMIDGLLSQTLENLEQPDLRSERVKSARGESLYLALWAAAFIDVVAATQDADKIAQEPEFERRYAAVHLLSQMGTTAALRILVQRLGDTDLRVALRAASALPHPSRSKVPAVTDGVFAVFQRLLPRVPEDQLLEPAIWEWNRIRARRAELAAKLISYRGNRPFGELAPYTAEMDSNGRAALLRSMQIEVKKLGELKNDQRDLAFALLRDASKTVRELAFQTLQHAALSIEEAESIEPLLARKSSDLRRGVMRLLLRQPLAGCRASIERLSHSSDTLMQQAAEELRSEFEPQSVPAASLQDGLGLFDPEQRTPPAVPRSELTCTLISAGSEHLARSLDALVDKHRETTVTVKGNSGENITELLGNLRWGFGRGENLPLSEVWDEWWVCQKHELGGSAELELARAFCVAVLIPHGYEAGWKAAVALDLFMIGKADNGQSRFSHLTRELLRRRLLQHIEGEELTLLLDVLEMYANGLAKAYSSRTGDNPTRASWRSGPLGALVQFINLCAKQRAGIWTREHWQRYWGLLRFVDEGVPQSARECPSLEIALGARRQGLASEADIYDQLLTPRLHGIGSLKSVTKRKKSQFLETYPELMPIVEKCRNRIIEVELKRGDLPTAASGLVLQLRCVFGAELALTVLKQLGKDVLSRGWLRGSENRSVVFSHLLRVCLPAEHDTPETFANAARRLKISRSRLVDLAVYAPQWANYVEHATNITGLQEAALWLHAHTKDTQWGVDEEIRELWFAEVSERTSVPRHELLDGAVDVDWFRRVRAALDAKDWTMMLDSAKYASGGAGHKRAELFALALTGEITRAELSKDVAEKRNQDSVRGLGLLPLPPDEADRRKEILARYEVLQKFLRGTKEFGAQRQASEKLAYSIGLANLARTGGYPDSQRLSWTMEAEASADLRSGSIEAIDGVVRGVLSINALGEPELAFEKNGKVLKDLPAAMKKSQTLARLRERKAQLAQQTSRMRESLEEAMIRGDEFTREELQELENHPLLKPMINCLLFTSRAGNTTWAATLNGGQGRFRIAHPIDLLRSGEWKRCQRECLELTRIQPFKQAFRELYVLTDAEREQRLHSSRYEGQQVNPKQALAIVGKRGWVNVPEEGIRKTYHHDDISAWVTFLEGWFTPAEVDGLTVQHVLFTNRSDGKVISLDQVHERVFSEAMRDMDLMVSVAHRGGVDPEATASTIEMRAALIRETLPLLKITNVRLKERYAFVDGKIGAYNVHLGSGSVHRQPGGSLCIIPVHSQHRGRFFLPFADNDPKTAEIVSKVLLLAQDDKIKDPTILEQLR